MPLGSDQQYDESWIEQDKMRRREEIRRRLKMENVERRYSPFRQLQGILYQDPAIDRYAELRKYGRMPGAPFSPKIFWTLIASTFIPIFVVSELMRWERKDYLKAMANGDIPYEQRKFKLVV